MGCGCRKNNSQSSSSSSRDEEKELEYYNRYAFLTPAQIEAKKALEEKNKVEKDKQGES